MLTALSLSLAWHEAPVLSSTPLHTLQIRLLLLLLLLLQSVPEPCLCVRIVFNFQVLFFLPFLPMLCDEFELQLPHLALESIQGLFFLCSTSLRNWLGWALLRQHNTTLSDAGNVRHLVFTSNLLERPLFWSPVPKTKLHGKLLYILGVLYSL